MVDSKQPLVLDETKLKLHDPQNRASLAVDIPCPHCSKPFHLVLNTEPFPDKLEVHVRATTISPDCKIEVEVLPEGDDYKGADHD